MFQFFGSKWLEAKFGERLQNLKAEQDRALRHVQSTMDREIHRAKKLYDSEFTALSECWRLLRTAYDYSNSGVAELYPPIDRYTDAELQRLLSSTTMEEWERTELKAAQEPKDRLLRYRKWALFERLKKFNETKNEFRRQLDVSSIFFAEGFKEKFEKIDALTGLTNAEFCGRIHDLGQLRAPQGRDEFMYATRLSDEGATWLAELEKLVRARLWSASTESPPPFPT